MYDNFNKEDLGKRIHTLRIKRWEQYKSSENEKNHPDKKYEFCKTQASLAEKLKVERRAVQSWESGTNTPSVENLVNLSRALDCNIDYFLGDNDFTEFPHIALASKLSGVSPEIIKYNLEHPDYRDCLNFFMHPDNCKSFFNDITITMWRKYWTDTSLSDIKSPFKDEIIKAYDEYSAITPINEINRRTYTAFLKEKFPENKLILRKEKKENGYTIKGCFKPIDYQNFFNNKQFNYSEFIKYLSDNTFNQLSNYALIEIQKSKLAKVFIDTFMRYIAK